MNLDAGYTSDSVLSALTKLHYSEDLPRHHAETNATVDANGSVVLADNDTHTRVSAPRITQNLSDDPHSQ